MISTGGVRTGLDAAPTLALGATLIGMGFPFLKAASESLDAVREFLEQFLAELRPSHATHWSGQRRRDAATSRRRHWPDT